jgi:hypothetical protein
MERQILHLEGETHQYRKPVRDLCVLDSLKDRFSPRLILWRILLTAQGALRFTTPLARSAYAKMMVYDISPPPKMLRLAEKLAARMQDRVGGRMWVAAHMRRGDFVKFGWAMNEDSELHFRRITSTLEKGRE